MFRESQASLQRYARRIGAGDDAEDVVQDVWLRLQSTDGPIANPKAYLIRMVYTATLDRQRGAGRAMERDAAWSAAVDDTEDDLHRPPSAERALIARQQALKALAAIAALGEPAASIFRLHRLARLTQSRIARDMGLSVSTIEKHLRRAYHALARLEAGDEE